MDAASVTFRTRAQIERVERDVDEARKRTFAAKEGPRHASLELDRRPLDELRPFEEESCLD